MPITYRLIYMRRSQYHMILIFNTYSVVSSAHTGVETWAIHYAAPTYRTPLLPSHGPPIKIAYSQLPS
jgi:hypothetical protein